MTNFSFDDIQSIYPEETGFNALSKELGIGRNTLYKILRKHGVLDLDNYPTLNYKDKGYFKSKIKLRRNKYDGDVVLLVTAKGYEFISNLLFNNELKK